MSEPKMEKEQKIFVVVDSENQWLHYGREPSWRKALESGLEALKGGSFNDDPEKIYVFEIAKEHHIYPAHGNEPEYTAENVN